MAFSASVPVLAQEAPAETAAPAQDGEIDAVTLWREDPTVPIDAQNVDLEAFRWIARPVVVFADTPEDPAFIQQMELFADRPGDLAARGVVMITDTDPAEMSDVRRELRPRGFQLTLVGQDGGVKLRKPFPWNVRELTRVIDKMPARQRELREGG